MVANSKPQFQNQHLIKDVSTSSKKYKKVHERAGNAEKWYQVFTYPIVAAYMQIASPKEPKHAL